MCRKAPLIGRGRLLGRLSRINDRLGCRRRQRGIFELLATQCGLEHQPATRDGEHRHALAVTAVSRTGIVAPAADPGGNAATCISFRGGTGSDGNRGGLRAELEVTGSEILEGLLVLEEYDLAVGLATKLHTEGHLAHGHIAHVLCTHENTTLTEGAPPSHARFSDSGEHGVAIGGFKVVAALSCVAERAYGFTVTTRGGRQSRQQRERQAEHDRKQAIHGWFPPAQGRGNGGAIVCLRRQQVKRSASGQARGLYYTLIAVRSMPKALGSRLRRMLTAAAPPSRHWVWRSTMRCLRSGRLPESSNSMTLGRKRRVRYSATTTPTSPEESSTTVPAG